MVFNPKKIPILEIATIHEYALVQEYLLKMPKSFSQTKLATT